VAKPMTCKDVMDAVVGFGNYCLWSPRRSTIARNTHAINGWEADILIIQDSGRVYEVEVKVSVSDFRREFEVRTKKHKHRSICTGIQQLSAYRSEPITLSRFYFAMPKDVYEKVKAEIPEYAGVIVVVPRDGMWGPKLIARIEVQAPHLKGVAATDKHRVEVMRSVYLRAWGDGPIEISGNSGELEVGEVACG